MLISDHVRRQTHAARHGVTNGPRDFAHAEEILLGFGRCLRWPVTVWGGRIFMAIAIAGGGIGLTRFAAYMAQHGPRNESDACPNGGIIVRADVIDIWLPLTLDELVKRRSRLDAIREHEDLQHFLEGQGEEDVAYAVTTRAHQLNGEEVDMIFIHQPYNDPGGFSKLVDVLETAAGNPPNYPSLDFSTASVHIVDDDSLNSGPSQEVAEMLGFSYPTVDQEISE